MTELVNLSETTVIKSANAFCVSLRDGRLPVEADHPLGAYLDDCRHLRGHELSLGGQRPRLLISSAAAGTAAAYELTNPDLVLPDGRELQIQSLRVRMERRMRPDGVVEQLTLRSHARHPVDLHLELRVDADFRPMLEVRGIAPVAEREVRRRVRGNTIRLSAVGADGQERSTVITSAGATAKDGGRLCWFVSLEPGEQRTIEVRYDLHAPGGPQSELAAPEPLPAASMPEAGAEADSWLADRPRAELDGALLERVLERSLLDLRLLTSDLDGHRYYAAGVPWYATLFGRDSIISSLQMLAFDPVMAEETTRLLAGRLGTTVDDEHDEEPGKVLHELRLGELAVGARTPLTSYYGTVDATPLFLCLLCEQANWTGSLDLFHDLRPQVDAALRWVDEFGDLDGDSLLEYRCRSSAGLENQGWKDSWDGVLDEQGEPLRAPIALVEPQGYVIAAKRQLARLFELDGDTDRARRLRAGAARTATALERFWLDDRGFYSMGLDADKRPSRALASNQGHLLWALAVSPERAAAIRDALMSPASYSGWGVRTLAADEAGFNPVGYHTGTVWPHDNSFIALGLRRYGFDDAFLRILDDLVEAAYSFTDYRLPELFAGFSRTDYETPVPYPVACSPQAWAAGSLPAMVTAGLGLVPNGLERALHIQRPTLPSGVRRLALQGLRVGDAVTDLLFERVADLDDRVAVTDARVEGDLEIVLDPGRRLQAV